MKDKMINEEGNNFADRERPGISGEELPENAEDGCFSLDREWRFLYVNKKAETTAGKNAADLIGKVIWEEYPLLAGTEFENAYRTAMEKRIIRRFEMKGVATGTWYNIFAIPSAEGITVYWQDISAQKEKEEEAGKANAELADRTRELQAQRLLDMLETLPVMVRLMKPDHRIVFSNRAFLGRFGESGGRHCHEYFCGKDTPCPFCEAFVPLETGKPHHWELNCPDSGTIIDAYDFPFSDADGSPLILEMDIDITERKKAEEALREKTRQLDEANRQKIDILESISDCFYALDKELRFTYVNRAAEEIWGISRADLLGHKIEDTFPGIIDISLSKFRQVLEEQIPQYYEVFSKVIRRWGDMNVYPIRDGISVYFHDITGRKLSEEALAAERKRFFDVLESLPVMICLLTPDRRVVFDNRPFREKFGESGGRHCYEYCCGFDRPCAFCESFLPLTTGRPHHWEFVSPDGGTVLDAYDFPFSDTDGSPLILEMDIDITERKRAEEALRESEEKYRLLFENMTEMFQILEPIFDDEGNTIDFRYVQINEASKKLAGEKGNEIEGKTAKEVWGIVEDYWLKLLGEVLKTGESVHTENYSRELDTYYDLYAWKASERRVAIVFSNITDKKRAEEALRQSEEKYRELVEHSPAGIFEIDFRTGQYTSVNDAMCIITGYSREELLNMDPPSLLDDESAVRFQNRVEQWLSGEKPEENVDYKVITKDGRKITALLNSKFKRDEKGNPLGAYVIGYDITERKKAEEMINRQNAVLISINEVYEASAACAAERELGGECLKIIKRLLGNRAGFIGEVSEDGGLKPIAFDSGDEIPGIPENMAGHRRINGAGIVGLYRSVIEKAQTLLTNDPSGHPDSTGTPAGHFRLNSFLGVPFVLEGRVLGLIGAANKEGGFSGEDRELLEAVTPSVLEVILRKKAEEELQRSERQALILIKELEEADRNKDKFLNVLSHELRNPLASISAGVDLMELSGDKERQEKAREIVRRQINQLKKLIDDLMDVSRITQNKTKLQKEKVGLNGIVRNTTADIKPEFEKRGITLYTKIQVREITLSADASRISQMIGNLLSNSLKFTQKGGAVWLTVRKRKNDAVITVKDNGSGISPGILPNLFKPFTQGEQALDRRDGGLGLGLSIVKGIAELHGGSVSVYSAGPGKGSEFTVRLPVKISLTGE